MKFLIDDEHQFALGWNPKCGNTHLKKIWYYLHDDDNPNLHRYNDNYNKFRPIPKHYTILIVCRNPYERLVSGFLDRLRGETVPKAQWSNKFGELTFENYVNQLVIDNWTVVNKLHFQKQISDQFPSDLSDYKNLHIQDIHSVDYSLLEKIFSKIIPNDILTFRGDHQNKRKRCDYGADNPGYKIPVDNFVETVPLFENFYNKTIYDKVTTYFKDDLIFFSKFNLNYNINYSIL